MVVILEFFRQSPGVEGRINLATDTRNIKTADVAVAYARGAINNVIFNGRMADGCAIKSQKGMLICEVRRNAHRPEWRASPR